MKIFTKLFFFTLVMLAFFFLLQGTTFAESVYDSQQLPTTARDNSQCNTNVSFSGVNRWICDRGPLYNDSDAYVLGVTTTISAVAVYTPLCDSAYTATSTLAAVFARWTGSGYSLNVTDGIDFTCTSATAPGISQNPTWFPIPEGQRTMSAGSYEVWLIDKNKFSESQTSFGASVSQVRAGYETGSAIMASAITDDEESLTFLSPQTSYTGGDFANWIIDPSNDFQSLHVNFRVHYGSQNLPVHQQFFDEKSSVLLPADGSDGIVVTKNNKLYRPEFATTTQWAVYAEMLDYVSGERLAISDVIYIAVTSASSTTFADSPYLGTINPLGPEGDLFPTLDCSAYTISLFSSSSLAGIGCVMKKTLFDVFGFFFIPKDTTLAGYAALSLEDKFPFAYWYDLKETFEAQNASSTNAFPSLTLQLFPTSSVANWSLTASFSSSTISSYLGSTMISLFRTLMQAALWMGFVYFIYRKLKAVFDHSESTT